MKARVDIAAADPLKFSRRKIAAGFAVLLLLGAALIGVGFSRISAIADQLRVIVDQHTAKTDQVIDMRNAARERMVLLNAMANTADAFERDDMYMRFNEAATQFIQARTHLQEIGLTPEEAAVLRTQQAYTNVSVPLQMQVVDLLNAERFAAAREMLTREALPSQNAVIAELDKLLLAQKQGISAASRNAAKAYRQAYFSTAVLGIAGLLVGIGIVRWVGRAVARAEAALFREKELAQTTLQSIGDAVITTDAEGRIDVFNPGAERLTGWTAQLARGRPVADVFKAFSERDGSPCSLPTAGEAHALPPDILLEDRAGNRMHVEGSLAAIKDRAGEIIGTVLSFRDVTHAHELALQLSWQATHDALTNLHNRREFERRLQELLGDARRTASQHALIYIDLDQFKIVNDTCGHKAGDELLRQLAAVLEARLRRSDILARLGGDEFGVLLEGCNGIEAERIAGGIRTAIAGYRFIWGARLFDVSASIGVVAIDKEAAGMAALLSAADAACYAAKDAGRNRVHVYQPDDAELRQRRDEMQWVSRLRQALEEGRLRLTFQLIAPLRPDTRATHYELFVSVVDEDGSTIFPAQFIPAAERYGLMPTLDRWVVRTAFERLSAQARRPGARRQAGEVVCAINISGTSINDERFLDYVREQLKIYRVPPESICFEITETAAVANLKAASILMRELKALGCRFALDDFGAGMSSFGYLRNFPVDYLKIDGAIVRDIAYDDVNYAMVDAINRIGHVSNIKTVAEFVESQAILDRLRTIGIDYAQGYFLHTPEPLTSAGDPEARAQALFAPPAATPAIPAA